MEFDFQDPMYIKQLTYDAIENAQIGNWFAFNKKKYTFTHLNFHPDYPNKDVLDNRYEKVISLQEENWSGLKIDMAFAINYRNSIGFGFTHARAVQSMRKADKRREKVLANNNIGSLRERIVKNEVLLTPDGVYNHLHYDYNVIALRAQNIMIAEDINNTCNIIFGMLGGLVQVAQK